GYGRTLARIDEAEQHQVAEQDAPVGPETPEQALPVQPLAVRAQQVGHVRPVVALALLDERLGPDTLLDRSQAHRQAEKRRLDRVLEPGVVAPGDPVASAEDDVHEVTAAEGLAEPVWIGQLDVVAGPGQGVEGAPRVSRSQEDVEILSVSLDARVLL